MFVLGAEVLLRLVLTQLTDPGAGFEEVLRAVEGRFDLGRDDLLLLPELVCEGTRPSYEQGVLELARRLGCSVVGGSHYEPVGDRKRNSGIAASPEGEILARYEKHRPYGPRRDEVEPGESSPVFRVGGRRCRAMICSDFWHSELIAADREPELFLIPAFSTSRAPTPSPSRALWKHLAVARAYEFGAFVGISDWAHPIAFEGLAACGVAGFASPVARDVRSYFRALDSERSLLFEPDWDALDELRHDQAKRGFLRAEPPRESKRNEETDP